MKNVQIVLIALCTCFNLSAQEATLFDENTVASIHIYVKPDSLEYIITNLVNDEYIRGNFIFTYNNQSDTVENIGLRLRGNTSLWAQKKSFKVSFNAFEEDGEFQGLRKLNLRGSHNDPSMMREKLFYKAWGTAGLPERRAAFVELYLNNTYYGLYTNVEEIDKRWLTRAYGNNDGNLYKCQWPASLAYLGTNPQLYKEVLTGNNARAYELKTNETADDYSRFAQMIATLNEPVDAGFPAKISAILNVESALKAFAFDVASGNWDDYFYNQNNYYLYDNPATGKFEFFTLDTDNTFGVDWLNKDWAKRECLDWESHSGPRPLATKLMAVPEYKQFFIQYLHYLTENIVSPDALFPYIDQMHALISPAAQADYYRTLDYDYDFNDFNNSITQTIDNHTPYGIKPFLETRRNYTLQQLEGLVGTESAGTEQHSGFELWPNPANQSVTISDPSHTISWVTISDATGRVWSTQVVERHLVAHTLPIGHLPIGMYFIVTDHGARSVVKF